MAAASDTSNGRTPGLLTIEDLAGYLAKTPTVVHDLSRPGDLRHAIVGWRRRGRNLGHPRALPDERLRAQQGRPQRRSPDRDGVHLIAEAERLAYADRDQYIADVDFVRLPGGSLTTLVDPGYLAARAALISPQHSMGSARPGTSAHRRPSPASA